jgi:hypothetical protein
MGLRPSRNALARLARRRLTVRVRFKAVAVDIFRNVFGDVGCGTAFFRINFLEIAAARLRAWLVGHVE